MNACLRKKKKVFWHYFCILNILLCLDINTWLMQSIYTRILFYKTRAWHVLSLTYCCTCVVIDLLLHPVLSLTYYYTCVDIDLLMHLCWHWLTITHVLILTYYYTLCWHWRTITHVLTVTYFYTCVDIDLLLHLCWHWLTITHVLTLTYYCTCVDIDSWVSFGFSNNKYLLYNIMPGIF